MSYVTFSGNTVTLSQPNCRAAWERKAVVQEGNTVWPQNTFSQTAGHQSVQRESESQTYVISRNIIFAFIKYVKL